MEGRLVRVQHADLAGRAHLGPAANIAMGAILAGSVILIVR